MVAMGKDGKPIKAPKIEINTEFEQKLFEAALMRKESRMELYKKNKELTAEIPDYNSDIMTDG